MVVEARFEVDAALSRAEEALKPAARMMKAGIAETRTEPKRYRVAVCERPSIRHDYRVLGTRH